MRQDAVLSATILEQGIIKRLMAHYRKRLFKLIHHQKPNISKDTQAIAVNDKDDLFPELCDILNKSRIKNSSLIPGDMASDTFRVAHDDEANKG